MLETPTSGSDQRFTVHEGAGGGNGPFSELRGYLVEHRERFAEAGVDVVSDRGLIESVYQRFKGRPDLTADDIAHIDARASKVLDVLRAVIGQPRRPPAAGGTAAEALPEDMTPPPLRAAG